ALAPRAAAQSAAPSARALGETANVGEWRLSRPLRGDARWGRESARRPSREGSRGALAPTSREIANMFVAYEVSLEVIRNLRDVVTAVKRFDPDLADQMRRAASSVSLNLGEGAKRTAGNQRQHYEIAHGSANEVKACLDVADAWGYVAASE